MTDTSDSARIVVGVDGSAGARAALQWAIDEATHRDVPLALVHAWRPLYRGLEGEHDDSDAVVTARTHGNAILAAAQGTVVNSAPGLRVAGYLRRGRPSAVLLEAAVGALMLVVGARGVGGAPSMRLGSVGLHAAAHAPCTTVVVRGHHRVRGPVLVGVDGSPESKAVLEAAFEEALGRKARLIIASALYVHPSAEGVADRDRALEAARSAAHAALSPLVDNTSQRFPDVEADSIFPIGYPAEVLANASVTAQLLVVGSHGGGGFAGMQIGSIAHAVVHEARCPVMVVRETKPAP